VARPRGTNAESSHVGITQNRAEERGNDYMTGFTTGLGKTDGGCPTPRKRKPPDRGGGKIQTQVVKERNEEDWRQAGKVSYFRRGPQTTGGGLYLPGGKNGTVI